MTRKSPVREPNRARIPTILRPYNGIDALGEDQFKIEGPPIRLGDRATNGFALVLHELATNAAKYGALKVSTGSVQVAWRLENGHLLLTWQERGGPAIDGGPTKQGFGSVLSRNTVVDQLRGTLRHDWHPTGLWSRYVFQSTTCRTERGNSMPRDRLNSSRRYLHHLYLTGT